MIYKIHAKNSYMNNDVKKNIILPAWNTINKDSKIKKFYTIPWLLSIIFITWLLVYQTIYTYVVLISNNEEKLLKTILHFLEWTYGLEVLIVWIIFIIIYLFLIPIFEWWLIKYIYYKDIWKDISSSQALWQWLYKFLPIFEYNNLFSEFKLLSILNFYLFILRFVWLEFIKYINILFIVIFIFSVIINIMFVYSKYFIILENKNVFQSIWESSKLVILNFKNTFKLFFLILFLNLRVIINFIIFLAFPIIIAVSVWLITSKFILILAISILGLIFISIILFLWYLTAVLEVFKTSIWYYAYKEWKKISEDID